MSLKSEAIKRFLTAARSLANQGLSKDAIVQFAKNEFGEITELFKKQIDNIFNRPASGIEKIKIKDEVFDDTVVKLPLDDTGQPFNPNDPLKQYGKPKKKEGIKTIEGQMEKINKASSKLDELIKEREAMFKPKKTDEEVVQDLIDEKFGKGYFDTVEKPKFRLNVEKFKKDFNVADDEIERITKLSSDEQQKTLQKYIDKDFKERIELSDYDVSELKPNAEGGIVGYYTGGLVDVEPSLSDIGHGSDALMARTRLMSPGSQATTSTGLNYLLAEDNDNIRVPFAEGSYSRSYNPGAGGVVQHSPMTTTSPPDDNRPPEPVVTGVKPVTVIEKELDEPFEFNKFSGKLMTKRDMLNKQNFIDFVNRFGYESGKDGYADRLYDTYSQATGIQDRSELENIINLTSQNITNETDDIFKNINARTTSITVPENTDLNVRSSTIGDGNTFTRREVRPSGIFENGVFIGNTGPASLGVSTQGDYVQNLNPLFAAMLFNQNLNQGGRAGFSKGKLVDAARRKFMKAAGTGAAGLAALKTGLLGFGEKAAPVVEKVAETVSETAQSVPPYFFRLVEKIRAMGDDTLASQDKAIAKKYKDYVMEEEFGGNITIVKSGEDLQGNKLEDVYMSYKVDDVSVPDKDGFRKVEEYEEFTARPDMEGKMKDVEPGVPDEVIEEAGEIDAMTLKKASGGIARMLGE